jgi:ATP-dependent Clp protease ATP-binding subunit ClpB
LANVQKRLTEKRIALEFAPDALTWLGEKGFDSAYGARPLKRVIQNEVLNPLAKLILEHKVNPGDRVQVARAGAALSFNVG